MHTKFSLENLKRLGDQAVDRYNIKIYIKAIGGEGVAWIDLAQDRVQWRSLQKTVILVS